MVCSKLHKGDCRIMKKKCNKKYIVKMVKYKDCPVYKKGKTGTKSKRKK
jgi:hypothetical protein